MKTIEIINIKTCPDWGTRQGDYYIGRGSSWGNPFVMKNNSEEERERVIKQFIKYAISSNLDISELVMKAKRLGCYCKPKACHGDYLVEQIEASRRILESVITGYLDERHCEGCWHKGDNDCLFCYREVKNENSRGTN